jgi:antirestriction protein ArdC
MTIDIAQIITDRIISELEKGSTPWVKPWKRLRSTCRVKGCPLIQYLARYSRAVNH